MGHLTGNHHYRPGGPASLSKSCTEPAKGAKFYLTHRCIANKAGKFPEFLRQQLSHFLAININSLGGSLCCESGNPATQAIRTHIRARSRQTYRCFLCRQGGEFGQYTYLVQTLRLSSRSSRLQFTVARLLCSIRATPSTVSVRGTQSTTRASTISQDLLNSLHISKKSLKYSPTLPLEATERVSSGRCTRRTLIYQRRSTRT